MFEAPGIGTIFSQCFEVAPSSRGASKRHRSFAVPRSGTGSGPELMGNASGNGDRPSLAREGDSEVDRRKREELQQPRRPQEDEELYEEKGRNLLRWFGADRSHIDEPNSRTSSFLPRASLSPSSRTEKMRSKFLRESCTFGYLWINSSNPNSARRRSSSLVFFALGILGFTLCVRAFPILPRASRLRPSAPTKFCASIFWASTNSFLLETPPLSELLGRNFDSEVLPLGNFAPLALFTHLSSQIAA